MASLPSAASVKVRQILNATACQVALELGYSKESILCCYEAYIRAGDLVRKILDAEEKNGGVFPIPQLLLDEEKERRVASKAIENRLQCLRIETLHLWNRSMCHACGRYKSDMLALPCAHILVCQKCTRDMCIACNCPVIDWIRVYV